MRIEDARDICHPHNPGREILADVYRDIRPEIDRIRGLGWTDALRDLEIGTVAGHSYLRGMLSLEGAREDLMKARAACVKLLLILDARDEAK